MKTMVLISYLLLPERQASPSIESLNLSIFEPAMTSITETEQVRLDNMLLIIILSGINKQLVLCFLVFRLMVWLYISYNRKFMVGLVGYLLEHGMLEERHPAMAFTLKISC